MTETAQAALIGLGVICGAVITVLTLAGMLWKFARPWIREELALPVQETRDQVSNNHDKNLRDDFDDLRSVVDRIDSRSARIGRQLDVHLESAAAESVTTNARIAAIEQWVFRKRRD